MKYFGVVVIDGIRIYHQSFEIFNHGIGLSRQKTTSAVLSYRNHFKMINHVRFARLESKGFGGPIHTGTVW